MTPIRSWVSPQHFNLVVRRTMKELEVCNPVGAERFALIRQMQLSSRDALSPLERLETERHPWVGFVIMPLIFGLQRKVPAGEGNVSSGGEEE